MKVPEGFVLSSMESCAKLYYVIQRGEEKRFYTTKKGELLHFKFDTESGWPVPTNARQEYKQTVPKSITDEFRKFRKDFYQYAQAYWDLISVPTPNKNWYQRIIFPDGMLTLEKTGMYDLLKLLKSQAFVTKYKTGLLTYEVTEIPLSDLMLKKYVDKFKNSYFDFRSDEFIYTKIPLGTLARNYRYEKDKRRKRYLNI
jgi:hypothetical protein